MEKIDYLQSWGLPKDTRFRRRLTYLRYLALQALVVRRGHKLCSLGKEQIGCSWTFSPDEIGPESTVYSGGVGNDISFEHGLVNQFGCTVNLLDPSPTGIATMDLAENRIPHFKFLPIGLAGSCCTLRLSPPLSPQEGSWFSHSEKGTFEAPCLDLASLLKQNHHSYVDILKLDIEGAEYGVVDHIIDARIPVRQILVEFHDGLLPGIRRSQSLRAGFRLITNGYRLIAILGTTYTFIRAEWPACPGRVAA